MHARNHLRRIICDSLKQLGDWAGELGLHIAVQPLERDSGSRSTSLHTLDDTLDVLNLIGHPHVGMVLDSYHLRQEVELSARMAEVVPHTRLVALSDCQNSDQGPVRCYPGEGILKLAELVRAIEAEGYRGGYELQVPTPQSWSIDLPRMLLGCRESWKHVGFDLGEVIPGSLLASDEAVG